MVTMLYPLYDLPKTGSDKFGGKASNLSILISAGFPVPQGFVIAADAYEAFLAENGLKEQISECLASTDFNGEASLRLCSARVKELITSSAVSPSLSEAVGKALLDAGSGKLWAVRSSAIAEDLAEASFAGQQDTYLNVGESDLADRIRCCWASYWNERAIASEHLEQYGKLKGQLRIGRDEYAIDGMGERDHSWGVRDWNTAEFWLWLNCQFSDSCAFNVTKLTVEAGDVDAGYIYNGEKNVPLVEVIAETSYDMNGGPASITDKSGSEHRIDAEILRTATLPFKSRDGKSLSVLYEPLAKYTMGEKVGYGVAEYLVRKY